MNNKTLSRLKKATFIVGNKDYNVVALRYKKDIDSAPKVLLKTSKSKAKSVREFALQENIPLVEYPALSSAIYQMTEESKQIPEELYEPTIAVLQKLVATKNLTRDDLNYYDLIPIEENEDE